MIVSLTPEIAEQLKPRAEARFGPLLTAQRIADLTGGGFAYAMVEQDQVIATAGIADLGLGRAEAWAEISREASPHSFRLTRAVRRSLATAPWLRIEAHVDKADERARRWIEVLGFRFECNQPCFAYGATYECWVYLNGRSNYRRRPGGHEDRQHDHRNAGAISPS